MTGTRRLLKRAKLWVLLVCVVGIGLTCSQALAEEPPPTDPTPTVPEPPPVTGSGPVITVSSPPTPSPVPAPDPQPVQRRRAPAKRPAPVRKPAPAPKQAPARASDPATNPPAKPAAAGPAEQQPATPTPLPATTRPATRTPARPATRTPARPATTAPQLRASKLRRILGSAQEKKKPTRAAAAPRKAGKAQESTSPLEGIARDVPSVPAVSALGRGPAPSGAARAATSLRWLFVALLGTAAVFLTTVGSRRVFDYRMRARLAAGEGHVIARVVPPPAALVAKRNGKRPPKPEPAVTRSRQRKAAPAGTCEIGWSRGYFKSDFYVATPEPEGGVSEVARSPAFRWTAAGEPPQDEAIAAAHAALVEKLVAMGWEEVGAGESWYARRYRRRLETAV